MQNQELKKQSDILFNQVVHGDNCNNKAEFTDVAIESLFHFIINASEELKEDFIKKIKTKLKDIDEDVFERISEENDQYERLSESEINLRAQYALEDALLLLRDFLNNEDCFNELLDMC